MSKSQDLTPQLHDARHLLSELTCHIEGFDLTQLMYRAPILDRIRYEPWGQDEIMGWKKWFDGVENHMRLLDAMIESGIPPKDDPIPTVLNLITYWKIIITSESPIVGVKMSMGGDKRLNNPWPINKPSQGGKIKEKGKEKEKEKEVWVDVIAQGGREWKRIYSKKISHLLAEFREADSYLNSDYDSDSSSPSASSSKSKPTPGMDNSLITTAQDLLRAASLVECIPGAPVPKITIHLTRIPSSPKDIYRETDPSLQRDSEEAEEQEEDVEWPDDRLPLTFQKIRELGVNLIFGDLSQTSLSSLNGPTVPAEPIPSLRFNLDITTLMGLCSDVLHHPLPTSKDEAASRSLRPTSHLLRNAEGEVVLVSRGRDGTGKTKNKLKRQIDIDNDDEKEYERLKGQSQNSIELYKCILEEMERPFIEEFNNVIQEAWKDQRSIPSRRLDDLKINGNPQQPQVEFWTTLEAAQYTYEALSSGPAHGHGMEQLRMRRMLGLEQGDFFEGSRYQGNEGYLKDLKINIFDLDEKVFTPRNIEEVLKNARKRGEGLSTTNGNATDQIRADQVGNGEVDVDGKTGFHQTLHSITSLFLNQYYLSLIPNIDTDPNARKSSNGNEKIKSQNLTINLPNFLQPRKLPTPPIAKISLPFPVVSLHSLNRGAKEGMTTIMMGTATLKEVWTQVTWRLRGWERGWYNWDDKERKREKGNAAVMIFPYRVFGEGKRVRFEKGDYSYPTKDWWDEDDTA
ncbi:hypothetical protein V865_001674 [Kwoniella europaea PYCC6329]|uniref:DUF1308 domain-containing protein n=1 Tax=Kwoniella europaea PYCC6329 TaxID=1423913 RepID=A0AAX4KCD8_9TREE